MAEVLGTLSSAGWVTAPDITADRLLSYFFISNHSQSNTHRGKVKSLTKILEQETGNLVFLRQAVTEALTQLFSPFYDSVQVDVKIAAPTDRMLAADARPTGAVHGSEERTNIIVSIDMTKGGKVYTLGRSIMLVNNTISKVTPITQL